MRAPSFWHRAPGLWSTVLAPLGWIYAAGTRRRLAQGPRERVGAPVICVGNLNAGGTGKTPTVIALLQHLSDQGITAHVVSRGYGGSLEGPVRVDERTHSADQTGDEPLLMAAFGPTWVAKDRAAGARAAVASGAQVILLDDGFQNPALHYDLSLVVVDARQGFGNGRVIPAGPLREPIATGLARADLVVTLGAPDDQTTLSLPDLPRLRGEVRPLQTGMNWAGLPVFAFAGIGYPEKFFRTLKTLGVDLRGTVALADHQPLTAALLTRLGDQAAKLSAQPITTEKDAVRLPASLRGRVMTLPVRLEIEDWTPFDTLFSSIQPR